MKKLFILLGFVTLFTLSGCLEITQELTVNSDGSGELSSKMDMSAVMAMLSQMGGTGKDKIAMDSSIAFSSLLDSAKDLSMEEKQLVKDAVMDITINTEDEKFIISNKAPFKNIKDVDRIKEVMKKWDQSGTLEKALSSSFGDNPAVKGDEQKNNKDNPFNSSAEDYFDLKCTDGKISRKLIKEKYEKINEDETMAKIKEAGEMGAGSVKSTFIINLPRPVKTFTGKNVVVSADKKKVTVENTLDELFDDATKYEFSVEY